MGRDILEFGADELRIVGGDYGQVVLEGTTPEARAALDTLVGASRCGDDRARIDCLIALCDDAPPVIPARYAGREGQTEIVAVGGHKPDVEGAAAPGTDDGTAAHVP